MYDTSAAASQFKPSSCPTYMRKLQKGNFSFWCNLKLRGSAKISHKTLKKKRKNNKWKLKKGEVKTNFQTIFHFKNSVFFLVHIFNAYFGHPKVKAKSQSHPNDNINAISSQLCNFPCTYEQLYKHMSIPQLYFHLPLGNPTSIYHWSTCVLVLQSCIYYVLR